LTITSVSQTCTGCMHTCLTVCSCAE